MEVTIKIFIVIVIFILFIITTQSCFEQFKDEDAKLRQNKLQRRHEEYIKELLVDNHNHKHNHAKINQWQYPNTLHPDAHVDGIYNRVYQHVINKINNSQKDIKITKDHLLRFHKEPSNNSFIFEIVFLLRLFDTVTTKTLITVYADHLNEYILSVKTL